jgi:hypothetical protein
MRLLIVPVFINTFVRTLGAFGPTSEITEILHQQYQCYIDRAIQKSIEIYRLIEAIEKSKFSPLWSVISCLHRVP